MSFSWSSYGNGNYISFYLLRLNKTSIENITRVYEVNPSYRQGNFALENGDLYFYPNGDTTISGGGGAYIAILS